ncbi:Fra a 1-associated protein [Camellia lanceoleosa]|uniref:Fra a 1-associated protein n=1 Tax=Camellia lanceoleosa TaxID=1840588 RepID=A0ACC0IXZ8_9ERIC|nr:Fra a 1-associated protein [Camellia lanceoleosa]
MPAFEFNTSSATAICNLESGMGWVWKKDEAEEDNSNPRSDDQCSTTKIVKSHCPTEEVEPGKFIRKCEKTEQILRDCVGSLLGRALLSVTWRFGLDTQTCT